MRDTQLSSIGISDTQQSGVRRDGGAALVEPCPAGQISIPAPLPPLPLFPPCVGLTHQCDSMRVRSVLHWHRRSTGRERYCATGTQRIGVGTCMPPSSAPRSSPPPPPAPPLPPPSCGLVAHHRTALLLQSLRVARTSPLYLITTVIVKGRRTPCHRRAPRAGRRGRPALRARGCRTHLRTAQYMSVVIYRK
jgi:hypothetical protein